MTSIGQPGQVDQTDTEQVIVGVDTHRDVHVAAAVTTLGGVLGSRPFPATAAGYHRLLGWAGGFGTVQRAGVEGTGCYGAALARYLRGQDIQVVEVNRPDRAVRRRRGKNDAVDAEVAARTVLSGQPLVTSKTTDGPVEMVRVFKLVRDSAVKARTQAINQLKAVLVGADPALRENLSRLSAATLVRRCTQLADPAEGGTASAVVHTLRLLARRVQQLSAEARDLAGRITAVLAAQAPRLLDRVGVGPDTAAALLIAAGDNPQRLRRDSAYAALCGASPVHASSGQTVRHRLNRGGDRHANAALHRIAITRLRCDPRTRDYIARRTAEGKTRREAIRCVKRYIAREIHTLIQQDHPAQPAETT